MKLRFSFIFISFSSDFLAFISSRHIFATIFRLSREILLSVAVSFSLSILVDYCCVNICFGSAPARLITRKVLAARPWMIVVFRFDDILMPLFSSILAPSLPQPSRTLFASEYIPLYCTILPIFLSLAGFSSHATYFSLIIFSACSLASKKGFSLRTVVLASNILIAKYAIPPLLCFALHRSKATALCAIHASCVLKHAFDIALATASID